MKSSHLIALAALLPWLAATASPPASHGTTIHQLPDRRVIIERAPGIILPAPPAPVVRPAPEPATAEQLAEHDAIWRAYRISHPTIHAGATIYKLPDGRILTYVNNWSVNNGPMVSFWSSADFSLVAHPGGFTRITSEGEVRYTMLLFWSRHDVAKWKEIAARGGREYASRDFPAFPDGPATWVLDEAYSHEKPDAATTLAITRIHQHYQENLAELRHDFERLETEREARRAELEANPPIPRDIHLRVSRLDPAQAAAWHKHAVAATPSRREAQSQDGGAK